MKTLKRNNIFFAIPLNSALWKAVYKKQEACPLQHPHPVRSRANS